MALFLVGPKISPFSFGSAPLSLGESATLQCTVSDGDRPLNIRWVINGSIFSPALFDASTYFIEKHINVLTIESLTEAHAGNYTCEARNPAATARYTTTLVVNGSFLAV